MKSDSILKIIADNQLLFDELKKVFEDEFNNVEPIELGFSNERLGERVRAKLEGKILVEKAFSKILSYQTPVSKGDGINPAR